MPNQLNYPDEERRSLHEGINQVIQDMVSKKRKRGSADMNGGDEAGSKRGSVSNVNGNGDHMNGSSGESFSDNSNDFSTLSQLQAQAATTHDHSSTAAAALAAQLGVASDNPNLSFVSTGSGTDLDRHQDSSFDLSGGDGSQNHNNQSSPYTLAPFASVGGTAAQVQAAREASNGGAAKPAVGTDEWHKVRRDNHKEVERRRRETINEGINELAKIVPGCEKNKGSILQSAVSYILQLKTDMDKLVEVRTRESLIVNQALAEQTSRLEQCQEELQKAWKECEGLKKRVREKEGVVVVDGEEEEEEGESE